MPSGDDRPILVTGATGNVGREVVKILASRGVALRATIRDSGDGGANISAHLGPAVTTVPFDFAHTDSYDWALRGTRALFLLRPPAIANVKDTLNVLVDRAAAAGVERIVFLSVAGADKNPMIPHHAVEQHLLKQTIPWVFLRPGFFAQNLGDAYRQDIRLRNEIRVPAGKGRVAFVDVRDVAEVAANALTDATHQGHCYTLTGSVAVSFAEAAALLTELLGRPIRYVPAGIINYVRLLRRQKMSWGQVAAQTILHVGIRRGEAGIVDASLARLLGRPPRVLADYVRDSLPLWDPNLPAPLPTGA